MRNIKSWMKGSIELALAAAAICCLTLGLLVLGNRADQKAGIITFTFDFVNGRVLDSPSVVPRDTLPRSFIPPFPSAGQSAESVVETALSSVTSQAKSAAGGIETGIPGVDSTIPKNLSLGTTKFCVGFSNHINCQDLPVDISKVLPKALTSFGGDLVKDFQSLEEILGIVTPTYTRNPIICGLVVIAVMAIVYIFSNCTQRFGLIVQRLGPTATLGIALAICSLCCILFSMPMIICSLLWSKAQTLRSKVGVNKGEVGGYSSGSFTCVLVVMALAIAKTIFYQVVEPISH